MSQQYRRVKVSVPPVRMAWYTCLKRTEIHVGRKIRRDPSTITCFVTLLKLKVTASNCVYRFMMQSHTRCGYNLDTLWTAELAHSPFAAGPLISDVDGNGKDEIIAAPFSESFTVLQGQNGQILHHSSWPAVNLDNSVHASPLQFDIDHDGMLDIMFTLSSGELRFYSPDGVRLKDKTYQKNWQSMIDKYPDELSKDLKKRQKLVLTDFDIEHNEIEETLEKLQTACDTLDSKPCTTSEGVIFFLENFDSLSDSLTEEIPNETYKPSREILFPHFVPGDFSLLKFGSLEDDDLNFED
ncbi:unnamed protein product [Mytilus edulis]|uniref:Uncharacterized protein n=1 Tax=Mytilus edulis TaxID=6550 RepID=A0A8S3UXH5_MYTED|nr:unnamed protein product [Mytilus edulis]